MPPRPNLIAALGELGYSPLARGHARRFKTYGTWEHNGVRLALSSHLLGVERGTVMKYLPDDDRSMTIEALITDPEHRGQGRARQAMQDLTALADPLGCTLYLQPVPLEKGAGPNHAQLARFYASLGFVPTDPSCLVMQRPPAGTQPTNP